MLTALVLVGIAAFWFVSYTAYLRTRQVRYRVRLAVSAWALLGALVGCGTGVAAFGSAVAGTVPGALLAAVLAYSSMYGWTLPRERAAAEGRSAPRLSVAALFVGAIAGGNERLQRGFSLGRALVGFRIGPLSKAGLYESFRPFRWSWACRDEFVCGEFQEPRRPA